MSSGLALTLFKGLTAEEEEEDDEGSFFFAKTPSPVFFFILSSFTLTGSVFALGFTF